MVLNIDDFRYITCPPANCHADKRQGQANTMAPKIESNRSRFKALRLIIPGLAIAGCVFGIVYYLSTRIPVPPMPRVGITPAEESVDLDRIKKSLTSLRLGAEIGTYLEKIEQLNLSEIDTTAENPSTLETVQREARAMSHDDPEGYRLLGMKLSLEFMDLLESLLADAVQASSVKSAFQQDQPRAKRLERLGGSFLRHAMDKGVIESDGRLNVSRLALAVMFQARWNHLGGLAPDDGLGPASRKAFFDWTARFTEPVNLNKRLSAIGMLKAQETSYDDVLAKAIVLYEAGKKDEALSILNAAIATGRQDKPTVDFARALTPR